VSELRRFARSDRSLLPAPQRLHQLTNSKLELLEHGQLEVIGRLTDASNATFVCRIQADDAVQCVYKPVRGERPLDDFPTATLARRETAAYAMSEATGWEIVPPTVLRDGPLGLGMVQLWIDIDDSVDLVEMVVGRDERLRRVCVFDALANNADRKGAHLLPTESGHIYGVDHGICFSAQPKLRTVLWGWRGEELNAEELAVVRAVCDGLDAGGALRQTLSDLLSPAEVAATAHRAEALLKSGRFPQPDPSRPALPWPPF
jgi:hypothetical protein